MLMLMLWMSLLLVLLLLLSRSSGSGRRLSSRGDRDSNSGRRLLHRFITIIICLRLPLLLLLMWLFIVTRYVHAWVHLNRNYVLHRSRAFFLGAGILLVAWIWFALHLLGVV